VRRRARAFVLVLVRPGHEAEAISFERFPFVIGRGTDVTLRVEAPGVWDRHLILDWKPEGIIAMPGSGALATVNGHPFERHRIRSGDELTLGSVRVQFHLAPLQRRALVVWEAATWALIALVAVLQLVLVLRVLDRP
jgi:hypothetical protein